MPPERLNISVGPSLSEETIAETFVTKDDSEKHLSTDNEVKVSVDLDNLYETLELAGDDESLEQVGGSCIEKEIPSTVTRKKISGRRVRRWVNMFLLLFLAALVPKVVSDLYHSTNIMEPVKLEVVGASLASSANEEPSCKLVVSPEDFKGVWERHTCLKIVKGFGLTSLLLDEPSSGVTGSEVHNQLGNAAKTITTLDVDARINEKWLEVLVTNLYRLSGLRLRMDGLCEGACVKERNNLNPVTLPHVTHLTLDSDSHWCDIITWIFKWEIPNLKTLTLRKVKFSKKTFKSLEQFLKKRHPSLEKVELQYCSLCDYCELNRFPDEIKGIIVNTGQAKR